MTATSTFFTRTVWALAVSACLLTAQSTEGTDSDDRLNRFKAVFLYNFIDYLQWPSQHTTDTFKLGILGTSDIEMPLREIAQKKSAWGRPLQIDVFDSVGELHPCHILFISPEFSPHVSDLSLRLGDKGTLLVADTPGMAAYGASINFVLKKGKLKFEVNRKSLERAGLKASAQLLKLAILVSSVPAANAPGDQ